MEAAHGELLKYFQSVTSNRWLIIKIFCVLIVFFIVFVVFMAWIRSSVVPLSISSAIPASSFAKFLIHFWHLFNGFYMYLFFDHVKSHERAIDAATGAGGKSFVYHGNSYPKFSLVKSKGTQLKHKKKKLIKNFVAWQRHGAHHCVAHSSHWGVTLCRRDDCTAGPLLKQLR